MTTEPVLVDRCTVELVKTDFDDRTPVLAARTSTVGDKATMDERAGLIRRLITDGHGVPFEHMHITFRLEAPLFIWPQIQQHRAGTSLSRESGRYRELKPRFYIPHPNRDVIQVGKPMDYQLERGTDATRQSMVNEITYACKEAWDSYRIMMVDGVAREVARMILPMNTMSVGVMTFNARSLMHFLQLRTYEAGSHPQYEIADIAYGMSVFFEEHAPQTFYAFADNGWKSP